MAVSLKVEARVSVARSALCITLGDRFIWLLRYNITMSKVFEGKLRRLGNSMAVIIPRDVLEEVGAKEGDVMKLSLPIPMRKRSALLRKVAGIDSSAKSFIREKRDRF